MPACSAARAMPIASLVLVMVMAVTMSAPAVGEGADLQRVIGLGRALRHDLARHVAVAARADAAAHHHRRRRGLVGLPQVVHEADRVAR